MQARDAALIDQFDARAVGRGRALGRRSFLTEAAVALGTLTAAAALPTRSAAAVSIDALLLNCIDYRLTARVTRYMTARGLAQQYDQVVLAGSSLAAVHPVVPAWNQTFWEHVQVALELHGIGRIIAIDHRDCGAFQVYLGRDYGQDPAAETEVHAVYLDTLRKQINSRYPQFGVELLLMNLDGSVADLT
jgi:hypothetical protein